MKKIKTVSLITGLLTATTLYSSDVLNFAYVFEKSQTVMVEKFVSYCKKETTGLDERITSAKKHYEKEIAIFKETLINTNKELSQETITQKNFNKIINGLNKITDNMILQVKAMDAHQYCSFLVTSLDNTNQELLSAKYAEYKSRTSNIR